MKRDGPQSANSLFARPTIRNEIERQVYQIVLSGYSIAAITIQQKGPNMITQIFNRRISPENLKPQLAQGTVLLIAAILFVAGFRKIAELELTETQMFLGFGLVISLVLQCFILGGLMDLKRKAAGFNHC